jgi:hypothetical protein
VLKLVVLHHYNHAYSLRQMIQLLLSLPNITIAQVIKLLNIANNDLPEAECKCERLLRVINALVKDIPTLRRKEEKDPNKKR